MGRGERMYVCALRVKGGLKEKRMTAAYKYQDLIFFFLYIYIDNIYQIKIVYYT